jgi:hypothetical protein
MSKTKRKRRNPTGQMKYVYWPETEYQIALVPLLEAVKDLKPRELLMLATLIQSFKPIIQNLRSANAPEPKPSEPAERSGNA